MSLRPTDLDAEQELDLGRLRDALVARWWLPVAGILVGAILGYLVSLGGGGGYRATATVFLGQPLSPSGNAQIQSLATNPSTVGQIVHAEANVRKVAHETGLSVSKLRSGISSQAVSGAVARLGQTPLVAVTVQGTPPRRIAQAANALARIVVSGVSGYTTTKIGGLKAQIASDESEITSIDARLKAYDAVLPGASLTDKLIILTQAGLAEQRRGIVEQDLTQSRDLLSLAQNVESSRVITHAAATKTGTRSHRNALVLGAFFGLILGLLAALLWEPAVRVARRAAS